MVSTEPAIAPKPIPAPTRPAHLPALTGLRFFLALWVILNHLVGQGHVYEPFITAFPSPIEAILRGGYLAVPTFFMLSGLVLARTYGTLTWNRRTLKNYFVGRFARVYPVYLLSLLVVSPFIVKAADQPKGWLVAMHLTLLQGWFSGHYTAGWNTPAWSLSCEMFFYALFPILALTWQAWRWSTTIAVAAFSCILTPLLWKLGVSDQLKPLVHLADFFMGIAIARALVLWPETTRRHTAGKWLYAAGILGSGLLIGYAKYLPQSVSVTTFLRPMNALLLLGFAIGGGWLARLLSTRPLVYLGQASYGMYILHIPILWWAVSWPGNLVKFYYVAFVIAVSSLSYTAFEEPMNRYLRGLVSGNQR